MSSRGEGKRRGEENFPERERGCYGGRLSGVRAGVVNASVIKVVYALPARRARSYMRSLEWMLEREAGELSGQPVLSELFLIRNFRGGV